MVSGTGFPFTTSRDIEKKKHRKQIPLGSLSGIDSNLLIHRTFVHTFDFSWFVSLRHACRIARYLHGRSDYLSFLFWSMPAHVSPSDEQQVYPKHQHHEDTCFQGDVTIFCCKYTFFHINNQTTQGGQKRSNPYSSVVIKV